MSKTLSNIDQVAKALLGGKVIIDNEGDTFSRNDSQEIVMNNKDEAVFNCVVLPAMVVDKECIGFHVCLEANAFEAILDHEDISYSKLIAEVMEDRNIDNPDMYEEIFYIDSNKEIPLLATQVHEGCFDDFQLDEIIETGFLKETSMNR